MDWARTAYRCRMRLWSDRTDLVNVRWFRAAPGAKAFTEANQFGSRRWLTTRDQAPAWRASVLPLGEQPGKNAYDKGENVHAYAGDHYEGHPLAYLTGGITGIDTPIPLSADGTTANCGLFIPPQRGPVQTECCANAWPPTMYGLVLDANTGAPIPTGSRITFRYDDDPSPAGSYPAGIWNGGWRQEGEWAYSITPLYFMCWPGISRHGPSFWDGIVGWGVAVQVESYDCLTPYIILRASVLLRGAVFTTPVQVRVIVTGDPWDPAPPPPPPSGQVAEGEVLDGSPTGAEVLAGQVAEGEVLASAPHGGRGLAGQVAEGEVLASAPHGGRGLAGQVAEGEVLAGAPTGGSGGPTVYLLDTFVGTAGTALTAHPMNTGPGWSAGPGTSGILNPSGTANVPSGGGNHANAGHHDGTCTLSASRTSTGAARVFFAFTDNTHFWEVRLVAGALQILETAGGAPITRASVAHTYTAGVFYAVTVTVAGTAVTASADGVTASYATMGTGLAATAWGLGAFASAANFRTFEVTA